MTAPGFDEELADAVRDVAKGMRKLMSGPLNDKAIMLLVSTSSGVGKRDCAKVIRAVENLAHDYLKEPEE